MSHLRSKMLPRANLQQVQPILGKLLLVGYGFALGLIVCGLAVVLSIRLEDQAPPSWPLQTANPASIADTMKSTNATAVATPLAIAVARGEMTTTPSEVNDLPPGPAASPTPTPSRPPASAPPTRIVIPAIGLDAPVTQTTWKTSWLEGVEMREPLVPLNSAGFLQGMAYPGNPGNTVICGHHNTGSQVFCYLVDVQVGDQVTLYVGEVPYNYQVTYAQVLPESDMPVSVRVQNAQWIERTDDERLTLVTCWPYTGSSHRVIVVALPAP